ncbi:MAG: hypothetical protein ACFHXK_08050 [bacterium]
MTPKALQQQTARFIEERTVLQIPTNLARYKKERLLRLIRKQISSSNEQMIVTIQRKAV